MILESEYDFTISNEVGYQNQYFLIINREKQISCLLLYVVQWHATFIFVLFELQVLISCIRISVYYQGTQSYRIHGKLSNKTIYQRIQVPIL